MKVIPPLPIRRLRATMELKALSLKEAARAAEVNYTQASLVLTGRAVNPKLLEKLTKVIETAPAPEGATIQ